MTGPVEKVCGHCGARFQCGQYGCWCGQMVITDRQYEWIAARYGECLCPGCLEMVSSGRLGPDSSQAKQEEGHAHHQGVHTDRR